MTEYIEVDFVLDPFVSIGEIAIIIPGVPMFFRDNYDAAELAARNWITAMQLGVIGSGRIEIEDDPPLPYPMPGDENPPSVRS
jgi:hypothetical protein